MYHSSLISFTSRSLLAMTACEEDNAPDPDRDACTHPSNAAFFGGSEGAATIRQIPCALQLKKRL
jgi:hypothetical protein